MTQNNKSNAAHAEGGIPWKHIVGFALSVVLTLLAVWVALYSTLTTNVKGSYYFHLCVHSGSPTASDVHAYDRRPRW